MSRNRQSPAKPLKTIGTWGRFVHCVSTEAGAAGCFPFGPGMPMWCAAELNKACSSSIQNTHMSRHTPPDCVGSGIADFPVVHCRSVQNAILTWIVHGHPAGFGLLSTAAAAVTCPGVHPSSRIGSCRSSGCFWMLAPGFLGSAERCRFCFPGHCHIWIAIPSNCHENGAFLREEKAQRAKLDRDKRLMAKQKAKERAQAEKARLAEERKVHEERHQAAQPQQDNRCRKQHEPDR